MGQGTSAGAPWSCSSSFCESSSENSKRLLKSTNYCPHCCNPSIHSSVCFRTTSTHDNGFPHCKHDVLQHKAGSEAIHGMQADAAVSCSILQRTCSVPIFNDQVREEDSLISFHKAGALPFGLLSFLQRILHSIESHTDADC